MNERAERIKKALIKELSDIILHRVKDPRIQGVISVTDVELSHDYRYAKAFISIFPSGSQENAAEAKKEVMEAIEESSSFIRGEVGRRIRLRFTPEIKFYLDESIEKARKINDLLDKISRGEV